MDLPSIIPVFALPNVVLFPRVPLPLHIFEPRYREMVRDAEARHEVIGMALLRGDWQTRYHECPEIFDTGCVGKIVHVERLSDGKFNILLHGLREFTVRRHIFDKPYRQAEVAWRSSAPPEPLDAACRKHLIDLIGRFLQAQPATPGYRLLRDRTLSDELLVNFFSYALQIECIEKQGILEADSLRARARRLTEVLEFHLEEDQLAVKHLGAGRCH